MLAPSRVLAVDWSGDRRADRRKIWLCEVEAGRVLRLEDGRSRAELTTHLLQQAALDPKFVVGLDFAFSFPVQFLAKRGHPDVAAVWAEVESAGEGWLAECPFPFWGKPGTRKPRLGEALFRATDLAVGRESGRRPMSVLQIGGAGAVGVGSLRGMTHLAELRRAGFSIWPFDPPRLPLVVEIWPRLFMGPVRKSQAAARRRYLERELPALSVALPPALRQAAEKSDDAFDALVAALAMDAARADFATLSRAGDGSTLLEGEIWRPRPVARQAT